MEVASSSHCLELSSKTRIFPKAVCSHPPSGRTNSRNSKMERNDRLQKRNLRWSQASWVEFWLYERPAWARGTLLRALYASTSSTSRRVARREGVDEGRCLDQCLSHTKFIKCSLWSLFLQRSFCSYSRLMPTGKANRRAVLLLGVCMQGSGKALGDKLIL